MTSLFKYFILPAILTHAAAVAAQTVALPDNPHVVMIFTDDMGYGDISSFAQDDLAVKTPNIDRLADEGMMFTQFYVAMPICSPSRAAVLSGMFSPETGLTNYLQPRSGNNNSDQNDYMDPELAFLPRTFQAAGYATAHVGKWHLGGGRDVDNAPSIGEYGYDEFYSTWESPNPDPALGVQNPPWNATIEPGQVPRWKRTEYMVDRTLDFMKRHENQPCFVTLWPDDLHTPFWPTPAMLTKYGGSLGRDRSIENFYGVLEEFDRQIGRLLDGLKAQGMEENTIIFFTGDNGPAPDYNRQRTDGLRGRKLSLYEGGIRQPFVIRWPGHIPANTENTQTILSSADLLPTLTSLADVPMSPEAQAATDGEDLSQAMLGATQLRENPLMWEYGRTSSVPRPGVNSDARSPKLAIRDGDFKLLLDHDNTNRELYNVRADPNETTNLASQFPTLVQELATQVLVWSRTLPGRSHPYPVFSTVNFNAFTATEVVSIAQMETAAGAISTAKIDGIAVDANGLGDIYIVHTDSVGKETLLCYDPTTGQVSKITDSALVAHDLGASPSVNINLVGGFDYAAAGHTLYVADDSLGINGQVLLVSIDAATGKARLLIRSPELAGLTDHTVRPDATIAVTRGNAGDKSIGTVSTSTGFITRRVTEAQLLSAAPGTTSLPPEAVGANSSSGALFAFAGGDGEVFHITGITAASPSITRLTQTALEPANISDIAVDQANNMFGIDAESERVIIIRSGGAAFSVTFSQIATALGVSPSSVNPTPARGAAARMAGASQSDLFLGGTGELGLVRLRFGTPAASVANWTLY